MQPELNNQFKEPDCPLCETALQAVNILNSQKDNLGPKKPKQKHAKSIVMFLVLTIIMAAATVFIVSKFSKADSKNNSTNEKQTNNRSEISVLAGKTAPEINVSAPNFITADAFGNKVALSDYRAKKPVLLVFWATWCGFCAQEKEDLKTFTARYQDKIQVLAVDSGESKQTIVDYMQKEKINFLMLLDEQRKIWNQYLVRGTPTHFLIGKDGKIITLWPGLASLADLEIMSKVVLKESYD